MLFSTVTITAILSALAMAVPHHIKISDLEVHNKGGVIESASFTFVNDSTVVNCTGDTTYDHGRGFNSSIGCGDGPFSFYLNQTEKAVPTNYTLIVYEQTAPFAGKYGTGHFNLKCHGLHSKKGGGSCRHDVARRTDDQEHKHHKHHEKNLVCKQHHHGVKITLLGMLDT